MPIADQARADRLFLRNTWYFAAWAEELQGDALLARRIAGVPVVIWKDEDGCLSAFEDRCPHRLVPLSLGKHEGDGIRCAYHGIKFGARGCLDNPHGAITGALRPQTFTLIAKYNILWLWLGDADLADPGVIPDFSFVPEAPPHAIFRRHLEIASNHQLLVDNILDLSHADFLHPDTLGGGAITAADFTMEAGADRLTARWDMHGFPALPLFRQTMPTPNAISRSFIEVKWYPSGVMTLENSGTPVEHPGHPGYHVMSCHVMTPANGDTTHYFYAIARDFRVDDAALNEEMAANFHQAFGREDKLMAEAQQLAIGDADIMDLHPMNMPSDKAAVTARRIFARLLREEQAERADSADRTAA